MKKILIDGHNLIPKVPGINLSDMDDEDKLISLIGDSSRLKRVSVELFFDNATPGTAAKAKHGFVQVHYVRHGSTADDAIVQFLRNASTNARNLKVVSSDHLVQAEARALRAAVISSEQFSIEMQRVFSSPAAVMERKNKPPSAEEVEEMLRLMNGDRKE